MIRIVVLTWIWAIAAHAAQGAQPGPPAAAGKASQESKAGKPGENPAKPKTVAKPETKPGEFPFQPRMRPKPGETFLFRSYRYLDGWFEFHDAGKPDGEGLWPTYFYQRKKGPMSGALTFDPVTPKLSLRLIAAKAINASGDQSRRVLGEWTAGGTPRVVLTLTGCSPWHPAPPPPPPPPGGKPGRPAEGFYTTVQGTLAIQDVVTPVSCPARVTFAAIPRDPETGVAKLVRIEGTFTCLPSQLGLAHPGLAGQVEVRWVANGTLDRQVLAAEGKSSLAEAGLTTAIDGPLPPAPAVRRRPVAASGGAVTELPAAVAAKQEQFRSRYYASMAVPERRAALALLEGLNHETTRDLLAQVCLMERDDELAVAACRMLAAYPDTTSETAEILASVMLHAPGGIERAGRYAEVAVANRFRAPLLGWFERAAKRHPWSPADIDSRTKQPRPPPDPASRRYQEWLQANRNRAAWERLLPAFNRLAGTTIPLDGNAMAAVRAWIEKNANAVIEADIALETKLAAGR